MKLKAKNTSILKPKSITLTNLEGLSYSLAKKHFGSIFLNLKNATGSRAKSLSVYDVKNIPSTNIIEGFIGNIGEKQMIASSSANDNSKITVYVFEKPSYELFSIEQNDENLSFFEVKDKIYTLNSYKIYNTNEMNLICLYLTLKN